jgi:hypothetical protein
VTVIKIYSNGKRKKGIFLKSTRRERKEKRNYSRIKNKRNGEAVR